MQFKFYDEVDPEQVNELMLMCHGEPADKKMVAKIRKTDPNAGHWLRMYALDGDTVVAQIGAAYPDVETTKGTMKTGFVEAVAARPSYARQGYAKALMKRVHEQMVEDGVELFVLGTSKTLVAYGLYEQLGYHDITPYCWGIKKREKFPRNDITLKVRRHKIENGDQLFKRLTKNSLGFVHRQKDFPKLRSVWGDVYTKAITFYRNEKPVGYALVRGGGKFLVIREVVCPKLKDYGPCLQALENRFKTEYLTWTTSGRRDIARQYENHGFQTKDSWGLFMGMDAKGKLSQRQTRNLLGLDKDKFQFFVLDSY